MTFFVWSVPRIFIIHVRRLYFAFIQLLVATDEYVLSLVGSMIDADLQFGAYRPLVPALYKSHSEHVNSSRHANEYISRTDYPDISSCAISSTWNSYTLIFKQSVNHDTSLFEFALLDSNQRLQLPVTAHLLVRVPATTNQSQSTNHENSFHEYNLHSSGYHVRPYTSISSLQHRGSFTLMVKRYDSWGTLEKNQLHLHEQRLHHHSTLDSTPTPRPVYYYTKTDHSYKPPGLVSTFIHGLKIGQGLEMKFTLPDCLGKIPYPFPATLPISSITMIAVGVGIAPMIRLLRAMLDEDPCPTRTIRLLYGVRTVEDILQRPLLDDWHHRYKESTFRVMYCVGSRWSNIHFGSKTRNRTGPVLPKGYDTIADDCKCLGWVDGEKVSLYGAAAANDPSHYVFICGLPGVYRDLVGKRSEEELCPKSQLATIGFSSNRVIKF